MNQTFQKGVLPDYKLEYPMTQAQSDSLPIGTAIVNPKESTQEYVDSFDIPTPLEVGSPEFERQLAEVFKVRELVEADIWPSTFLDRYHPRDDFQPTWIPEPIYAQGIRSEDPQGAANIVHMDKPIDLHLAVIDYLNAEGIPLTEPQTKHIDFLGRICTTEYRMAEVIEDALQAAFNIKWFYGAIRPEEMYPDLSPSLLTQYPEGCPNHPRYPAGHGSVAGALKEFFYTHNISLEAKDQNGKYIAQEIADSAYHWAMYRTLAGVHLAQDNLAGLAIGGMFNYCKDTRNLKYNFE